jgi:hypothetical protein
MCSDVIFTSYCICIHPMASQFLPPFIVFLLTLSSNWYLFWSDTLINELSYYKAPICWLPVALSVMMKWVECHIHRGLRLGMQTALLHFPHMSSFWRWNIWATLLVQCYHHLYRHNLLQMWQQSVSFRLKCWTLSVALVLSDHAGFVSFRGDRARYGILVHRAPWQCPESRVVLSPDEGTRMNFW